MIMIKQYLRDMLKSRPNIAIDKSIFFLDRFLTGETNSIYIP